MKCNSILIVEDDPEIREVLKMSIELEGYKVVTAANGQEGIEALRSVARPCLILLDLMMPVMNGWEFAEAIEADMILAQIPVVVVTAYPDKAESIKSKSILKKPVDMNAMFHIIKEYCA